MSNPDLPPDSITTLPAEQRTAAIRARYNDMSYSGPTPADRERDTVIGHLLDHTENLTSQLAQAQARVEDLEPGVLRSSDDLPDEPPLFTTRRLFKALEARVEEVERRVAAFPVFQTPAGPVTVRYWAAAPTPQKAEAAKQAVLKTAVALYDEQQPPPGRVPAVTVGQDFTPEHRYVLRAYRQAHGQPTVGAGTPTAVEVNGAVTWWNQQQAPTVEVTTSEPDAALYFVCQNRHPLAARTTTILENGVRRATHHEVVCPACEADGITEVRLPDLDESDDDD